MKLPETTQVRPEKEGAQEQEASNQRPFSGREPRGASLFVRMWAYFGMKQALTAFALDRDPELAKIIRDLVTEAQGQITERWPEGLVARFNNPLLALSAAKKLQQRLLTFQRSAPPQQVVASVVICSRTEQVSSADQAAVMATAQMLADFSYSAQILVSEGIYELAQHEPGFRFNPKAVREAGDSGFLEAIYELLWTDESTYGHLREAGQSTGIHTSGRYQIQAELGRGAMGVVYKAHDQLIGRTVALKTISIDRSAPNRKELIERLKQEAKAAGGLDHPNIITIYDVGQEEDRVYLSMQFLEGKTLQALLAGDELPSLPTLISYAEQICSAVGFAHSRNVIHRDLKPANLMLTSQGTIKVLDFGIAKLQDATLTQTGLVVGTPTHMAPEQASDRKIDHRTDIFALGSVFYELFTREKPFKGDVTTVLYKIVHEDPVPPSVIHPGLPGGIDAIIRKALAKNPKDRFQTCEEMGKAFAEQAGLLHASPLPAIPSPAKIAMPNPKARVDTSSAAYLLETTTVRAQRGFGKPIVLVLLTALIAFGGWAFYVKAQTGAFPLVVRKAVARVRQALPGNSGHEAAGGGQEPVQPANNQSGGESKPASGSPAPATSATAQPVTENPAPMSSVAAPTAAGDAGEKAQQSTARETPAPGQSDPAPTIGTSASSAAAKQNPSAPQAAIDNAPPNQSEPASGLTKGKPAKKALPEPAVARVDGFSRRDVPELLKQADAAARRGDYKLALYEYNLILKLDHGNAAARAGLRDAQGAH